jgi:hypothetical protein
MEMTAMFINVAKLKELMEIKFQNNYHEFSRQTGIYASQIYRVINNGSKAGPKFLGRFKKYCLGTGLNFDDYIFWDESLIEQTDSRP